MRSAMKLSLYSGFSHNVRLSDSAKSYPYSPEDELFLINAIRIIENRMSESGFGAETFRKEIGISRSHLHRRLKSLTNLSTTGFIRNMRLRKAAELLGQRVGTVSEIAYDTGFNNLSYFTCCFKKVFGVVPSEYFGTIYNRNVSFLEVAHIFEK